MSRKRQMCLTPKSASVRDDRRRIRENYEITRQLLKQPRTTATQQEPVETNVDKWVKIEDGRLEWMHKNHQSTRAEKYQGLTDAVHQGDNVDARSNMSVPATVSPSQQTKLKPFDHSYPRARLKSRKSFRTVESVQPDQAASHRLELWNTWDNTTNEAIQPPKEQLPSRGELQRKDWMTLNRARAKVGKTASTLHKWKLRPNSECSCGNQNQTMDNILSECTEGPHCTDQDLRDCTDAAQAWITHWRDKI
ncbi:ATP-dependent RNA helicase p62-like [Elysia marginata]|uniref:ATP-dependent RNA helicase p62-like n=1 Tax=Elysia marginata TaxID=1093978 RepID=A0AAV4FZB8_9GAST|nr:ATP-dependent RNA helicase p62-like [Elysia marginata]